MVSTDIFATRERQEILDEHGVKYFVDLELNFSFRNTEVKERAVRILEAALEL